MREFDGPFAVRTDVMRPGGRRLLRRIPPGSRQDSPVESGDVYLKETPLETYQSTVLGKYPGNETEQLCV